MVRWPEDRGPLAGRCSSCKSGKLVLWYGDRIHRVYKCVNCGMIHDKRGEDDIVGDDDVRRVVDSVFNQLKLEVVDLRAFVIVVNKVCYHTLGGRIPVLHRKQFRDWGYVVRNGKIWKK